MATAAPIEATEDELARVQYGPDGLVPAIVQDVADGTVLMVAWMNEQTLRLTLAEGRTVFWSRSREEVWRKGETSGERRTTGGILIPATAQMSKRLTWAEVVATGPSVRAMEPGDQVLFNPEDRYEVEVGNEDFIILRERDVHAVAAERLEEGSTGLYL